MFHPNQYEQISKYSTIVLTPPFILKNAEEQETYPKHTSTEENLN